MPQEDFVERWRMLVGGPPAIMLEDRRDMISILVATTDVAPTSDPRRAFTQPLHALRRTG